MAIHPAIKALEQEIEKRRKNANQYQDSGLRAAAYLDRQRIRDLEVAIELIKPWLGGET